MANPLYGQNKADDHMDIYGKGKCETATIAVGQTITAEQSGSCLWYVQAAGTITLPAVAAGLKYRFICHTAASANTFFDGGGANKCVGAITDENSVEAVNNNGVKAASGATVAGDWFEVVSDGTKWYVSGACSADGGLLGANS
jgi:hypothetical protein